MINESQSPARVRVPFRKPSSPSVRTVAGTPITHRLFSRRGDLATAPKAGAIRVFAERARQTPVIIWIALLVMVIIVSGAILAPIFTHYGPDEQFLMDRLAAPGSRPATAGARFWLGTDQLGRDIFSRLLYGTRISLGIGLVGMLIGFTVGTTLGLISGFAGKTADNIIMFLVDTQQALPFIVIALMGIAIFGTDLKVLVVLLGLAGWDTFARFARGMTLSARSREYVVAAQLLGQSPFRVMLRHILPNISAPLIVLASLNLTSIIMLETSLSFLGLGVQPPTPSWGSMVGEGRQYLNAGAWWLAIVPGVAIVVTTTSINFLGDWLRDVLDPTMKGVR